MALFIILPFVGGWIGYNYAPEKIIEIEKTIYLDNESDSLEKKEVMPIQDDLGTIDMNQWVVYEDTSSGISFRYPKDWVIDQSFPNSNKQVKFDDNYLSVSFDYLAKATDLANWLETNNFFSNRYYNYTYSKQRVGDGSADVYVSINTDTYDDAFVHVGDTVFYVRNGVNEHTGVDNEKFLDFVKQLTVAENTNLEGGLTLDNCGQQSLLDGMLFANLYFSENSVNPFENNLDRKPYMYGRSMNCPVKNNDQLISFSYFDKGQVVQAISRMTNGTIVNTFRGEICQTIGDFDSARLLKVSSEKEAVLYCLSGDAGEIAFGAAELNLESFDLEKFEWDSPEYSAIFNEVAEADGDLEFWKRYGYPR